MNGDVWYVDSSALVKVVVQERETAALRTWLRGHALVSSDLALVELPRAVRLANPRAVTAAEQLLATVDLIRLDRVLLERAGRLDPPPLRSLDAIHLAAALSLADDLAGMVCYDDRLAHAASDSGMAVSAPS